MGLGGHSLRSNVFMLFKVCLHQVVYQAHCKLLIFLTLMGTNLILLYLISATFLIAFYHYVDYY